MTKIKMEYDRMDEMAKTFQQGSEQLKDTLAQMQSIANTLQDGALLGQGGAAFSDAIRNKLCPSISRLEQKFQELNKDVLVRQSPNDRGRQDIQGHHGLDAGGCIMIGKLLRFARQVVANVTSQLNQQFNVVEQAAMAPLARHRRAGDRRRLEG